MLRELNIDDEIFINNIRNRCDVDNIEETEQNPEDKSYEKIILGEIFNKTEKSSY